MMSSSTVGPVRFQALDSDVESAIRNESSPIRSHPSYSSGPQSGLRGCFSSVKFLQFGVAVLAAVCLGLIVAVGSLASQSNSSSNVPSPVNPDPPNTLPGAVQVANIMATLRGLAAVAAANNGSRYIRFLSRCMYVNVISDLLCIQVDDDRRKRDYRLSVRPSRKRDGLCAHNPDVCCQSSEAGGDTIAEPHFPQQPDIRAGH